uniref:Uncharacterized protein n=1 Tax=Helianthus annuus TaxID=4232 RepID=A0A251TIN3_HELAN
MVGFGDCCPSGRKSQTWPLQSQLKHVPNNPNPNTSLLLLVRLEISLIMVFSYYK